VGRTHFRGVDVACSGNDVECSKVDGAMLLTGQIASLGDPSKRTMRSNISTSVRPGNRGSFSSNSPKMQPTAHMSMASVYVSCPRKISGALHSQLLPYLRMPKQWKLFELSHVMEGFSAFDEHWTRYSQQH